MPRMRSPTNTHRNHVDISLGSRQPAADTIAGCGGIVPAGAVSDQMSESEQKFRIVPRRIKKQIGPYIVHVYDKNIIIQARTAARS